jgi:hypothetical protein
VIGSLRDLAHALSVETVTVDQLVTRLGGRAVDLAGSVVVEDPTLDGVARASIVRQVHGGEPALLTLELATPVAVDELTRAFGTPRRIRPDHVGEPAMLLYDVDVPDGPYSVALLAMEDDRVSRRLTLRRDVRLG